MDQFLIDRGPFGGRRLSSQNDAALDALSPIDGRVFTTIAAGTRHEIDLAVNAARHTYCRSVWSGASPVERKKKLLKLADLIDFHALELAVPSVHDNGTEIGMACRAEPLSAATFRYYAKAADQIYGEIAPTVPDVLALVHREPLGVVAIIVPWNFPMTIGEWKIAPASAAGNTVALKPPEVASRTLRRVAELVNQAGIPDGVFNVVTGLGPVAGKSLGLRMDVSGAVGRQFMEHSARFNLKRCYWNSAVSRPISSLRTHPTSTWPRRSPRSAFFVTQAKSVWRGRACWFSRLPITASWTGCWPRQPRPKWETLSWRLLAWGLYRARTKSRTTWLMLKLRKGEPRGSLPAAPRSARRRGGYYTRPTTFQRVTPGMTLAQEEVFGPVLSVLRFETEEEAARLANSPVYGYSSAVWTSSLATAHRMVWAIDAGIFHVNTYGGTDLTAPLGGLKQPVTQT